LADRQGNFKFYRLEIEVVRITQASVVIEAESEEEAIGIWEEEGFNGSCESREDNESVSSKILSIYEESR
jgi:hypothetical protein